MRGRRCKLRIYGRSSWGDRLGASQGGIPRLGGGKTSAKSAGGYRRGDLAIHLSLRARPVVPSQSENHAAHLPVYVGNKWPKRTIRPALVH